MKIYNFLVCTLAAVATAAPAFPELRLKNMINPEDTLESLSDYFNVLATRVQLAKVASSPPVCDVSKAVMPSAPVALPPPSEGLIVRHVAVGRGTQNYTCETNDASAEPKAAGAVATLFNASCVAALYPDLLNRVPGMSMRFNLSDTEQLGASPLPVSGVHYFTNGTTPFFNLNTDDWQIGETSCAKDAATPAPSTAAVGQRDEPAVPWLKLNSNEGSTGGIKEVYRVNTAGGSAPATCKGMAKKFQVEYAAVYWFWADPTEES